MLGHAMIQTGPVGCIINEGRPGDRRVFAGKNHVVNFMQVDVAAQL